MAIKTTETLNEFLTRGGTIKKALYIPPSLSEEITRSTKHTKQVILLTMDEAEIYYGEKDKRITQPVKTLPTLNVAALPEYLRKKYVYDVLNKRQEEEDIDG